MSSAVIETQEDVIPEETLNQIAQIQAEAKKNRPKILPWAIVMVAVMFVTAILPLTVANMTQDLVAYFIAGYIAQFFGIIGFAFFIVFNVQLVRYIVSFVNVQKIVKELLKAHAKMRR